MKSPVISRPKIGVSRNTQSWQCWHFCTTSEENKLEVVANEINFNTDLQLS